MKLILKTLTITVAIVILGMFICWVGGHDWRLERDIWNAWTINFSLLVYFCCYFFVYLRES